MSLFYLTNLLHLNCKSVIILYVKVNPILFGDYDRRREERIEQRRKALTARRENDK